MSSFKFKINNSQVNYVPTVYSDGAIKVNVPLPEVNGVIAINISAIITDSHGVLALPSLVGYLRHFYKLGKDFSIDISIPYFPHARQDRFTGDNAFTLRDSVVALFKTMGTVTIRSVDVHSEVVAELFKDSDVTFINIGQQCFTECLDFVEKYDYIVAPDKGAVDRAASFTKNHADIIVMNKMRDPNSGHISYSPLTTVLDLKGKTAVIIDDIGDGCWTHILAADLLKEAGITEVGLVLTHGIFSKGLSHLTPAIDSVHTIFDWNPPKTLLKRTAQHEYL